MAKLECFKAYDIRGKVPSELNPELAYDIARAFVKLLQNPKKIVVGYDIRKSSESLAEGLIKGFNDFGVNVVNIGLVGTEMVYFGTPYLKADGGIMITASHNPPEYNGMKFVRAGSVPVSSDSGLKDMEQWILNKELPEPTSNKGTVEKIDIYDAFIENLKKFYDPAKIKPLKVVCDAGNGCVGLALEKIEKYLPIEMIKVHFEPNGDFPNGVPNPILPENRKYSIDAIKQHNADLGVAWDGDYDRCFFFDENGEFIEGYYIVGLLAKSILKTNPGAKIVHDPRLVWNTLDIVKENGGIVVQSKSGHAFIKEVMRKENAIYGGEMSAHHYFRDNAYSDSGMIPFLLVIQLMSVENKKLSELVGEMIEKYPCPGEINSTVDNPKAVIEKLDKLFVDGKKDYTDGLSVEFDTWRFNVRMSNTEPLIRLNLETKGDKKLMEEKTEELLKIIREK